MFLAKDMLDGTELEDAHADTGGGSGGYGGRPQSASYGRHGSTFGGGFNSGDVLDSRPSTSAGAGLGSAGAMPSSANQRSKMLAQQRELQKRKQQERMGGGMVMRANDAPGGSGARPSDRDSQFTPAMPQFSAPRFNSESDMGSNRGAGNGFGAPAFGEVDWRDGNDRNNRQSSRSFGGRDDSRGGDRYGREDYDRERRYGGDRDYRDEGRARSSRDMRDNRDYRRDDRDRDRNRNRDRDDDFGRGDRDRDRGGDRASSRDRDRKTDDGWGDRDRDRDRDNRDRDRRSPGYRDRRDDRRSDDRDRDRDRDRRDGRREDRRDDWRENDRRDDRRDDRRRNDRGRDGDDDVGRRRGDKPAFESNAPPAYGEPDRDRDRDDDRGRDDTSGGGAEDTTPGDGGSSSSTPVGSNPSLLDFSDMKAFLTRPCPKGAGVVQCYIERNKSGTNKLFPEYCLYMKDGDRFLLSSKKRAQNKTSNYLVSSQRGELNRNSPSFLGKLRANFLGTEFQVFDRGLNPKDVEPDSLSVSTMTVRQELGLVLYASNVLGSRGPRKMQVYVPKVREDGTRVVMRPLQKEDEMMTKAKLKDYSQLVYLINKPPRWNEQVGAYVLNFNGRVTMASVKNFQLVTPEDQEAIILQFGRVGKDLFTMDYQFPLSPFQAFAITLSSFDSKLACE